MNLARLKQKVAQLPQEPGVYFFRGSKGELLYIGKATNLRSRVQSYFRSVISSEVEKSYAKKGSDLSTPLRCAQDDKDVIFNVVGRSEWIGRMVSQVEKIEFQQTDSVLEALILESNLIKKYQPKYNTMEKDDKSFAYFVITKEEFPRVLILRKTDIDKIHSLNNMSLRGGNPPKQSRALLSSGSPRIFEYKNSRDDGREMNKSKAKKLMPEKLQATFGPYTSKQQMEIALKIIRRIFPFHAGKQKTEKGCLDFQLGLCPGPYAGAISKEDYKKNIDGIKMILTGKKKRLVSDLEKEMGIAAKKQDFEKAAELRNKIFALQHIRDVALITRDMEHETWNTGHVTGNMEHETENMKHKTWNIEQEIQNTKCKIQNTRIEAYDISNISGTDAVGCMVVFSNGKPDKSQYRKFKIKTVEGSNDVAMMREVLLRRFSHSLTCLEYQTSSPNGRGAVMKKTSNNDWPMPDLILIDGGAGHVNVVGELVVELGLDVLIVGVAKGKTRKNLNFQFPISNKIPIAQFPKELQDFLNDKNLVKSIMDEAHRFAITFHRKLRGKSFLK